MQTYFTIYKTTNLINDKFYIGQHQTTKVLDNYLGSGTSIVNAVKKYGKDKFSKQVLFVYDNFVEMNAKEQEILTEDFIKDPLCYNQVLGGQSLNLGRKQTYIRTVDHCRKLGDVHRGVKQDIKVIQRRATTCKNNRAKMSKEERSERFGHTGKSNGFYQKTHTEQTKQKIRDTIGNSRKGSKNNNACPVELYGKQYGTKKECYTSLGISKKKLNQILGDLKMKQFKGEVQC